MDDEDAGELFEGGDWGPGEGATMRPRRRQPGIPSWARVVAGLLALWAIVAAVALRDNIGPVGLTIASGLVVLFAVALYLRSRG